MEDGEAVREGCNPPRDRARAGHGEPMTQDPNQERALARQGRVVAIVIAAVTVLWMGAQWLGGEMGWDTRYVFLFDLLALAGFLWAMIVTYQIWRKRRND